MKKPKRSTIILYGLCAVIWTLRAIFAVIYREYDDSVFLFVLNILCSVIWLVTFIKWLIIYRSNTDEE